MGECCILGRQRGDLAPRQRCRRGIALDLVQRQSLPGGRGGTPEPGGLTSAELLWACREVAGGLDLVGADVVEVLPDSVGSRDITALVAERVVREILTGVVLRRRAPSSLARELSATYP